MAWQAKWPRVGRSGGGEDITGQGRQGRRTDGIVAAGSFEAHRYTSYQVTGGISLRFHKQR